MHPKQKYPSLPEIDPYARSLIKHKVRKLRAAGVISFHDGQDLAQELSLHALAAAPKYDAARGARATFYEAVLARRVASLLSARWAQKRDRRRARPLESVPETRFRRAAQPSSDFSIDVRAALAALPADLRPLADLFMQTTEAGVIRASGLSRQQVRGRRQRIAQHLRRRGLP